MRINLNKSTIGIPKKCLKLASNHISQCLTFIFNQSLQQGVVPDILKISKVTPIAQYYQVVRKNSKSLLVLKHFVLIKALIYKKKRYDYT